MQLVCIMCLDAGLQHNRKILSFSLINLLYVMQIHWLMKLHAFADSDIYTMDETAVWLDMVASSTVSSVGAKDVALKFSDSICITMKGDGTKFKPVIVLVGTKREAKAIDKEFNKHCRVASSPNGWMNQELTLRCIDEVLGRFAFGRRLMVWDSCNAT